MAKKSMAKKSCGTCKLWNSGESDPEVPDSHCTWGHNYPPSLPFWASINNGDHGDYTGPEDGKHCQTWEAKDG